MKQTIKTVEMQIKVKGKQEYVTIIVDADKFDALKQIKWHYDHGDICANNSYMQISSNHWDRSEIDYDFSKAPTHTVSQTMENLIADARTKVTFDDKNKLNMSVDNLTVTEQDIYEEGEHSYNSYEDYMVCFCERVEEIVSWQKERNLSKKRKGGK